MAASTTTDSMVEDLLLNLTTVRTELITSIQFGGTLIMILVKT